MNWDDPDARARLLEQVGYFEFLRRWNRHALTEEWRNMVDRRANDDTATVSRGT